jgi:sugar phosphate isomerase/epimerase
MLEALGLKQVVLGPSEATTLDEHIEALKRHGIKVFAWYVTDLGRPAEHLDWRAYQINGTESHGLAVGELLEIFKRHGIAPQLWMERPMLEPKLPKPWLEMTDDEKNSMFRQALPHDLTTTPQDQTLRVREEADHLKPLAQLAAPYGVKVVLYKHGGWIGMSDNQVAVVERLKAQGIANVGIVYRFIHAHDEVDDTENFPAVWKKLQPHVVVVDITGVHAGRTAIYPILYPSQGELEFSMMKTVQDSGWRGAIGVSAEKGGDDELNLRNNLIGLQWLAAELRLRGSGGPPPLSKAP